MVAYNINQPWIPVRKCIDFAYRFRFKKFSVAAGNIETMINVVTRLVLGQRIDMITYGYSLSGRLVALFIEHFIEFTLSDKKNIY